MAQSVQISDEVWQELAQVARKKRRRPQTLVKELIRDYLEVESDQALFEEMKADLGGREMSEEEAVEWVHQVRRERHS
jgi:predicted transcriptional regulator